VRSPDTDPVVLRSAPPVRGLPGRRASVPDPTGDAGTAQAHLVVAPTQPAVGVMCVRLQGELDVVTAPRTRRVLAGAVDAVAAEMARPLGRRPRRGRVVCDLDGLTFVAASGLGLLVDVAEHARTLRVDFVLVAACQPVRRVLELTGLDHFFAVTPMPEALADVAS